MLDANNKSNSIVHLPASCKFNALDHISVIHICTHNTHKKAVVKFFLKQTLAYRSGKYQEKATSFLKYPWKRWILRLGLKPSKVVLV